MILADFLPARRDRSWDYALQAGITHAIVRCHPRDTGLTPPYDLESLRTVQQNFATAGLTVCGLEGDEFDMQRIKLGLPGRDEDLENYRRMLANMGTLGIRLLCYNFMATLGWCRSAAHVPARGGALTNRFRLTEYDSTPVPVAQQITAEALWTNYEYFLRAVLPAAEEAGVRLGLHPDDPPLPALRGVARIFGTPDAIARALTLSDSPAHGLTFCQANFRLMAADLAATARRFAPRIVFVHFRDVEGTAADFTETFHDDGPTDMPAMLRLYHELGFRGPIRVDHVPSLSGEEDLPHGYAHLGRLFATGYMKGILDSAHLSYR
ncbi:MAG: TIM barrel protein [Verrucomicrobia bacterium]|nr:TIM barrel protein [Verrucomicrobiota bacterium]